VHPRLHTRLAATFGVRFPIIQTAMGWVATPELVAGTANAGAMGFLAVAVMRAEEAERAIIRTKQLTDQPFGVNFLMEQPGAGEIVESIVRHGVRAASYSRSPNPKLIERLKSAGVLCVPTVGAPRHAVKAVELGADVIVCQGGEGGGHTGTFPTSLLLPQVVDAVRVPVAAAGGFHDGRGLVAALAYGADGIAMGTRFLLTRESPVPRPTIERYLAAKVDDIRVTTEVDGLPQRVIVNEFVSALESGNALTRLARALRSGLAYRKLSGASIPELLRSAAAMRQGEKLTRTQTLMAANAPIFIQRAMVEGHPSEGVLPSGQVAGVIADVPSCAELVERIIAEAEARLADLARG
jgi:NAD(P)H-dependent flavin oxidoreductase YrpB (nitropropane dioxygenase family)